MSKVPLRNLLIRPPGSPSTTRLLPELIFVPPIEVSVTKPLWLFRAVTPEPVGLTQLPSARKKFVVPPPEPGTQPESELVKMLQSVVSWVAVNADGAAEIPLTFPRTLAVGIEPSEI